jgi:hypothetical protein
MSRRNGEEEIEGEEENGNWKSGKRKMKRSRKKCKIKYSD